jgi:hypothetical protein
MLKFFRSGAYSTGEVYQKLQRIVVKHAPVKETGGRLILLADHIKVSKEGLRMACVQKWHQESQNSGKGEYIEGHNFGVVSVLSESGGSRRSIPVRAEIHESGGQGGGDSIVKQMAAMMGETAKNAEKPAIGVCDAYFFSKTMLDTAAGYVDGSGKALLHIITRAKKNACGYEMPPVRGKRTVRRGRPKIYGKKVPLGDCFRGRDKDFTETKMTLYGKEKNLRYLSLDLLWKPVKRIVRFVLTEMNGARFMLMSSDTSLTPEEIIHLYSCRFKIEEMFDDLKNDLGGFGYHFWTKALPKRKRGQGVEVSRNKKMSGQVFKAKKAIEVFVCLHIIALAILSLLSIKHSRIIWDHYSGWLRTIRGGFPSVMVTKQVISQDYLENSPQLKKYPAFSAILRVKRSVKFLYRAA